MSAPGRCIFLVQAAADHDMLDFSSGEDGVFIPAKEYNALRAQPVLALELNMLLHPFPAMLNFFYPDRAGILFVALHDIPAVPHGFRTHNSPLSAKNIGSLGRRQA